MFTNHYYQLPVFISDYMLSLGTIADNWWIRFAFFSNHSLGGSRKGISYVTAGAAIGQIPTPSAAEADSY